MQKGDPELEDKCVRILFIFWVAVVLVIIWAIAIFYVIRAIDEPVKWDNRPVGLGYCQST